MKKALLLIAAIVATYASAWAQTYVVAGVESLCGSLWNGNDPNNALTQVDGDNYEKTYSDVAAGNYQFKVVKDGTEWYGDQNGNNVQFTVTETCDVTIHFNASSKEISVTGEHVTGKVFEINSVHAVGNGSGRWLNDIQWDPESNKMEEYDAKKYVISFTGVPSGEFQLKFAVNGSWADNFGGTYSSEEDWSTAVYNGDNIEFTTTTYADITIRIDLSSFDYSSGQGAMFSVEITPVTDPQQMVYYLKHPWGGGEWTWKALTWEYLDDTDAYSLTDVYGGVGVNLADNPQYENASWIPESDILFSKPDGVDGPAVGDEVKFIYYPIFSSLIIVYDGSPSTGINDVNVEKSATTKFVKDGQIVINHNGVLYNVMGQPVK